MLSTSFSSDLKWIGARETIVAKHPFNALVCFEPFWSTLIAQKLKNGVHLQLCACVFHNLDLLFVQLQACIFYNLDLLFDCKNSRVLENSYCGPITVVPPSSVIAALLRKTPVSSQVVGVATSLSEGVGVVTSLLKWGCGGCPY